MDSDKLKGEDLVKSQIRNYGYNYIEAEVCAVIEDMPAESMQIYMDYQYIYHICPLYDYVALNTNEE